MNVIDRDFLVILMPETITGKILLTRFFYLTEELLPSGGAEMAKAWPRFLPEPTPEAIAHALIIEASAIVVDELGEGHGDLFKAHQRAELFARALFGEDHLDRALAACAAQPNNENILLHHVMRFSSIDCEGDARPPLPLVATATLAADPPQYPSRRLRRTPERETVRGAV